MIAFKNWFKKSPSSLPNSEDYFESGNHKRFKDKDYSGAIDDFNKAIREDPFNVEAYIARGSTKTDLRDYEGAVADFSRAIELKPDLEESYFARGLARNHLNDHKGMHDDFSKLIELDPSNEVAYNMRASTKEVLKDYQGAINDYNTAIELDPKFAHPYYGRGLIKLTFGQKAEAFLDLSIAGELGFAMAYDVIREYFLNEQNNPDLIAFKSQAYYGSGSTKLGMMDFDGAISDFTRAIELDPSRYEVFNGRANANHQKKEYVKAIQDYSKAIELDPNFADGYFNRGMEWFALSKYEEAILDFTMAIKKYPQVTMKTNVYCLRGLSHLAIGISDKGYLDLLRARELGHVDADRLISEYCNKEPQDHENYLVDLWNETFAEDIEDKSGADFPLPEFSTFTDSRDGILYKTVKIGQQIWMAENLRYIPHVCPLAKDDGIWVYKYDGNDIAEAISTENYKIYGCLYSYEAALMSCPEGWHMPTSDEWDALIDYLGGLDLAEDSLRSRTGWKEPVINRTNKSGFSALPGGYVELCPKHFYCKGGSGYWWSRAEDKSTSSTIRVLGSDRGLGCLGKGNYEDKRSGLSVRCVKD